MSTNKLFWALIHAHDHEQNIVDKAIFIVYICAGFTVGDKQHYVFNMSNIIRTQYTHIYMIHMNIPLPPVVCESVEGW